MTPIRPDRIRRIEGGFAFISNRFLHDGFFASLTHAELATYLFLVLAGDRQGVSFYPQAHVAQVVKLSRDAYLQARDGLIGRDLIAFDGRRFQVLSLPPKPLLPPPTVDDDTEDAATIRRLILASLAERRR